MEIRTLGNFWSPRRTVRKLVCSLTKNFLHRIRSPHSLRTVSRALQRPSVEAGQLRVIVTAPKSLPRPESAWPFAGAVPLVGPMLPEALDSVIRVEVQAIFLQFEETRFTLLWRRSPYHFPLILRTEGSIFGRLCKNAPRSRSNRTGSAVHQTPRIAGLPDL
jgi:hypothetical protein